MKFSELKDFIYSDYKRLTVVPGGGNPKDFPFPTI